jgi:hypothetical protein
LVIKIRCSRVNKSKIIQNISKEEEIVMPWCPKCKSEYEEGVLICADCKVDLVNNLSDIENWQVIINAKEVKDAIEVVDYLKYAGIEKVKYEEVRENEEHFFTIAVASKEVDRALKFLKGYMYNKAEENQQDTEEEEEIENEYESENYKDDTTLNDLKSSIYSFGFVGIAAIIISVLSFIEVLHISFSNKYLFSGLLMVIGITFIIIAINSAKRINKEKQKISDRDNQIDNILKWFGNNYDYNYFQEKYGINLDQYDEGATYYIVVDKLKEEISKEFVDVDIKIINTVAELIYEKMDK